jgi:putative peptidoglycan lipid II flippase
MSVTTVETLHASQSKETASDSKVHSVVRDAALMSMGTLTSRILGMIRDQILFALFSKTITDAYVVSFRLPNMFRRLLGEGSLSVSFIPIFVEQLSSPASDSPEIRAARAKALASAVNTALWALTSTLSVLGVLFMRDILGFLLSGEGYLSVPGKFEETVFLSRIMFSYLFLVTTFAFYMGVANALKRFFIAGMAPALFNLICIISSLMPQTWGHQGEILAWGVIGGGIGQTLMVGAELAYLGFLPRLTLRLRQPGAWKVLRNMAPGILGLGVLQLTTLVNMSFASHLAEGSHSYVYAADRLLELPQSLIAISLGAALLPTLAQLWSTGRVEQMLSVLSKNISFLLFLSVPAAVGMYVLALPLVQVLFYRGVSRLPEAMATAEISRIYSSLLLISGVARLLVPGFYAVQNTWYPALAGAVSLIFHYFLARWWVAAYGLAGLMMSTTMAAGVNMLLLVAAFYWMIGPLPLKPICRSLLPMVPSAVLMGVILPPLYQFCNSSLVTAFGHANLMQVFAVLTSVGIGASVYIYTSYRLNSKESEQFLGVVHRRLRRRS